MGNVLLRLGRGSTRTHVPGDYSKSGASPAVAAGAGPSTNRREFCAMIGAAAVLPPWALPFAAIQPAPAQPGDYALYNEAVARVIPESGFQSRIALRDAIVQLVDYGVIDRGKFFALARQRGAPPEELSTVLSEPSHQPLRLTTENAGDLVNLLWPLGLSNYMAGNFSSPLNGESLYNLASTGGWTLGAAENGGEYFSAFPIVPLNTAQEHLVIQIAKATYRPCCDNSTFFQDCNHGSALLGLLQLGASQGLDEAELYREALAFNSFWFPDNYILTALYLKVFEGLEWQDADPVEILGFRFSALSSWRKNVEAPLSTISGLVPPPQGGANCGA